MRLALERDDRLLLIVAGMILLAATLASALLAPPVESGPGGFPSSYATGKDGAKAAYLTLQDLGYNLERWTAPPTQLPGQASHVVLILADPYFPGTDEEKIAIQDFVRRGGRVIATGTRAAALLDLHEVSFLEETSAAAQGEEFPPKLVGPLSRRAARVALPSRPRWKRTQPGDLEYYGDGKGGVVVSSSLGAGTIIWWAGSFPLTNYGITQASNLNLLLNSVGGAGTGRILWDEYYHGERAGLWIYLRKTPLPWGVLQLALLALAVILTYSRRSGPIVMGVAPSRLSPIEFVETVGDLYARKHAAAEALETAVQRFRGLLARSVGLPREASLGTLRPLMAQMGGAADGLPALLERCELATRAGIRDEGETLKLFQELHRYTRRLRLAGQGG
jgi:hypothetical protein